MTLCTKSMLCTGYKISYIIISTFNEYTFCTRDIHNWPHLSHTTSDTQLHKTCYLTQVHLVFRSCSTRRLWLALHGFTKLFMLTTRWPFLASWCPATRYSSPKGRQTDIRPFNRTLISLHYYYWYHNFHCCDVCVELHSPGYSTGQVQPRVVHDSGYRVTVPCMSLRGELLHNTFRTLASTSAWEPLSCAASTLTFRATHTHTQNMLVWN